MITFKNSFFLVVCGIFVGFINGFFGGGAGLLIVPFFIFALHFSTSSAHASSLFVILPITIVSCIIYILNGYSNFKLALPICIGSILGGILGAKLLVKLKSSTITIIFNAVMIIAGIKLLFF